MNGDDGVNLSISKIQSVHPNVTKEQIEKDYTEYKTSGKMADYFTDGIVEDIKSKGLMQHPTGGPPQLPDMSPFLQESASQVGALAKGAGKGLLGAITQPPVFGGALKLPFGAPQETLGPDRMHPFPQETMSDTGQTPENWQASLVNQLRKLPFVEQAEKIINPKQPYERAETIGEVAAPIAAYGAASKMTGTPEIPKLHETVTKRLTNALSPGKTNQNWSPALKGVLESGDLASAVQDAKVIDPITKKPTTESLDIKSHGDFHEAINQQKNNFWQKEVKPRLDLLKGQINKTEVLDEMGTVQKGISAKIEPNAYGKAGGEAANFYSNDSPMDYSEAQERVQDLNQRLNSFFKAPIPANEIEATAPRIASTLAERASLNKQIDGAVEKMTGEGIADFKKRYSHLKTIEEQAFKAKVAAEVRKSPGLSKALTPYMGGKILLGLTAILAGHPEAGAAIGGLGAAESVMRVGLNKLSSPEYNLGKAIDVLKKLPKAKVSAIPKPIPDVPPEVPQQEPPKPLPTVGRFDSASGTFTPSANPIEPFKPPVNPSNTALRVSPSGEVMPQGQDIQRLPEVKAPIQQVPKIESTVEKPKFDTTRVKDIKKSETTEERANREVEELRKKIKKSKKT
jgi:hypothetical protein